MRRLLSIPVVEIALCSAVGFFSLGICLAVDGFHAVMQMHADEEAGRVFFDNNPSCLQELKKHADNNARANLYSGLTTR